jgi:tRNA-2-methylthio-N6-dimethylallyladenosine synthase
VEVLIEGPSRVAEKEGADPEGEVLQLIGRTHDDRIVVFEGNRRQIGQTLPIALYDCNSHTLFGAVVTDHVGPEVHGLTLGV